jgi:hypothetical protein
MGANNMPLFTAEASLYKTSKPYCMTATFEATQVDLHLAAGRRTTMAAEFNITCYLNSYFRTYDRCISIGYAADSCRDVADGVAGSVCR